MTHHATKYFVADLVAEVGSMPALAAQIVTLTSDPDCDMGNLARVILSDSVMTMRFLALVNSAALSGGQEIRDLRRALIRLGLRRVRNVALCMGMHDMLPSRSGESSLPMTEFWKYSLATASCAEGLAWLQGAESCEDAWLAGILHGIGIAALDQKLGADFQRALQRASRDGIPLVEAELALLDFHHGELGGRILSEWKLPRVFVETVEYYPERFEAQEVSEEAGKLIGYLRNAIDIVRAIGLGDNGDGTTPAVLTDLVDRMQITDDVATALAAKVDRDVGWMSSIMGLEVPENHFSQVLEESKRRVARISLEGIDEGLAREDLEQQLDLARDIQQRLLPVATPEIPGCAVAAENRPSLHVSGDYFDFLQFKSGAVGLVIADVAGKGLCASLLASNLQASLRALCGLCDDPGDLLATVNNALYESTNPERFATLFLAIVAPDGKHLRYANAGHNPPLLLRRDGSACWLAPAGTPLGMVPDMQYPVTAIALDAGDVLAAYTDGLTETMDHAQQEFGEQGLEASVRAQAGGSARSIIEAVVRAVLHHAGARVENSASARLLSATAAEGHPFHDDLTMLVLKVL